MGALDGFWRAIRWVARALFSWLLGWEVRVEGLEHVPEDGGAVLAFNHHGYLDVVFVGWGPVVHLRRPVRFLAKAELFRHWASGWLMRAAGAVPVERRARAGSSRAHAYAAAVEALERGELVAVAPEQTISDSYELLPFKPGVARMAIEAGAAIVPAIGWGVQRSYPVEPSPGDDWWLPARLGGSAPDHEQVVAAHQARFRASRSRQRQDQDGGEIAS